MQLLNIFMLVLSAAELHSGRTTAVQGMSALTGRPVFLEGIWP